MTEIQCYLPWLRRLHVVISIKETTTRGGPNACARLVQSHTQL